MYIKIECIYVYKHILQLSGLIVYKYIVYTYIYMYINIYYNCQVYHCQHLNILLLSYITNIYCNCLSYITNIYCNCHILQTYTAIVSIYYYCHILKHTLQLSGLPLSTSQYTTNVINIYCNCLIYH